MRTTIISLISLTLTGNAIAQRTAMNPSQSMDVNLVSLKINNKSNINMIVLDRVKVSTSLKSMVRDLTNIKTESNPNFTNFCNSKFVQANSVDDEHIKEIIFVNNAAENSTLHNNAANLQLEALSNPNKANLVGSNDNKENKETASFNLTKLPIHKGSELKYAQMANLNDAIKVKGSNMAHENYLSALANNNLEQYGYHQETTEEILEIPSQESGFPTPDIFEKTKINTIPSHDDQEKMAFFYEETPVIQEPEVQEIATESDNDIVSNKKYTGLNSSFANFLSKIKSSESNNGSIAYSEDPQENKFNENSSENSTEEIAK